MTTKLKRYRLGISRNFPTTHPRKGEKTGFVDSIYFGNKKHTIRSNYDLWKKRMEKVQEGKAVIELFYWEGKPYNSKQVVFATLDKDSGCGVQPLEFLDENFDFPFIYCFENTKPIFFKRLQKPLAHHDGLSVEDFNAWFKGYDLSKSMAIIQFTKFRY